MIKTTPTKILSVAAIIVLASSVGSTAFTHESSYAEQSVTSSEARYRVSKTEAKSLIKKLLRRDYKGHGLKGYPTHMVDGKWIVTIKYNVRPVGGAYVDATTGRISPRKPPGLGN